MAETNLEIVNRYQKEIFLLRGAIALLDWDKETNMPRHGAKTRAEQSSFLEGLLHEKITSQELFSALEKIEKEKLTSDEKAIIIKLERDLVKLRKVPKEFIETLARSTSLANQAWKDSKEKKDFSIFAPHLEKIIELKKKEAVYINLPGHPYNGLLDKYEEGMTVEELTPIFNNLKIGLLKLLKKIESSSIYKKQEKILQKKKFEKEKQLEIVRDIAKSMGITNESSRIDLVEHPFTTTIAGSDVRITTKVKEDFPLSAFFSTVHEAGHALHELGVLNENEFNVLGSSPSYAVHESQSQFWEKMIALSEPFWRYYFPKFDEAFKLGGDFEQWYKEINYIDPDSIRTEADEVHYCLHIILRFEIERDLISGALKVEEVKEAWNKKTQELFESAPKDDSDGILQDSHWSNGAIGYFPTYAIGLIYASQLYKKIKEDIPDLDGDLFEGNFQKIKDWLDNKIHKYGARYFAEELMQKTTGEGLNPAIFLNYLNEKYSKIYELN